MNSNGRHYCRHCRPPKCAFKSSSTKNPSSSTTTMSLSSTTTSTHVTKIDSVINYPANLFCQVDATMPSSSSSSMMIDDRLWIYWQLPNNHYILTIDHHGKLLRIPMKRFDQFRKLREKFSPPILSSYTNDDENRLFDEQVADLLDLHDLNDDDNNNDNVGYDEQQQPDINDYRRITLASNDVRSRLTIIPRSNIDFGLYQCWAENIFGSNRYEPCLFNLTNNDFDVDGNQQQRNHQKSVWKNTTTNIRNVLKQKSKLPHPVTNCTTTFLIASLLSIRCRHYNYSSYSSIFHRTTTKINHQSSIGHEVDTDDDDIADRNLQFHLILKELSSSHDSNQLKKDMKTRISKNRWPIFISNQSNPIEPIFLLSNLRANSVYEAIIYVSNDFGFSDQTRIIIKMTANTTTTKTLKMSKTSGMNGFYSIGQNSTTSQNRFVLIIIIIFTIVLIAFSTLLSIAIGLCLYRRKRFTETFPLDDYSTGVFILDTTRSNTSNNNNHHHPTDSILSNNPIHHHYQQQPTRHQMMIYRDFVSSPPSSSTSPATSMIQQQTTTMNLLNPLIQQQQQQQPPMTTEFLYQPATPGTSGFLDLAVDRGNVQLIPSSTSPPLPQSSMASYLTFSNIEQQQSGTTSPSLMLTTTDTATFSNNLAVMMHSRLFYFEKYLQSTF
ncbi:hypothetical protein HUG17_3157 [Dermatophagoides farinae]|uniref:Uncharacterized protein n=1 Tax=Dermatophagoides farinae TaxID=6954 RepID=A0A9D4NVN6_DERFA|nr:hypothetical protein HUG17_3157 [Dermatophagoides farinae]